MHEENDRLRGLGRRQRRLLHQVRPYLLLSGILVLVSLTLGGICGPPKLSSNPLPDFTNATFDFTPADGSYNISWRQGAANTLAFSDVEFYAVDLQFSNAADKEYTFNLQVMADGTQIGTIEVTLAQGDQTPSLSYDKNEGAQHTPFLAVDMSDGTFWLACTTVNGNVRGNADKSSKNVEVQLRVGADHNILSTGHNIQCV